MGGTPVAKDEWKFEQGAKSGAGATKKESGKGDEDRLKVQGKEMWNIGGYQDPTPEKKDTRSLPQSSSQKFATAISSQDLMGKDPTSKYAGIGSDKAGNVSATGGGSMSSTTSYPAKKVEPQDDPEKKRKAAEIFFGMGGDAGTTLNKPAYTPYGSTNTFNPVKPNPVSTTTTTVKKPAQEVNLLDLDFVEPVKINTTTSTNNSANNSFNLLGDSFKPAGPSYNVYEPVSIDLPTYENYWTSMGPEIDDVVVMPNIKNSQQFKKLINLLRMNLVSEIDNEIICAGKNKMNEFILLYVVCNPGGKLDIKVKSNKKENMTGIVNDIRNAGKTII